MRQAFSLTELADGFELVLPSAAATSVAHWFTEERRCCAFLSFEMALVAEEESLRVRLRGPEGTKDILRPVLATRYAAFT